MHWTVDGTLTVPLEHFTHQILFVSLLADRLFGTCQKWYKQKDDYQYYLDEVQLETLEAEIRQLVRTGYSWDSLYTQCVLANILLAYRRGVQYNPQFCDSGGVYQVSETDALTEDTLRLLETYFEEYYDDLMNSPSSESNDVVDFDFLESDSPPGDNDEYYRRLQEVPRKKDEYVNIHKYQKAHKRDPLPASFLAPSREEVDPLEGLDETERNYLELLKSLNPSELSLLRDYLYDYLKEDLKDVDFSDFEDFTQIEGPPEDASEGYKWLDAPGKLTADCQFWEFSLWNVTKRFSVYHLDVYNYLLHPVLSAASSDKILTFLKRNCRERKHVWVGIHHKLISSWPLLGCTSGTVAGNVTISSLGNDSHDSHWVVGHWRDYGAWWAVDLHSLVAMATGWLISLWWLWQKAMLLQYDLWTAFIFCLRRFVFYVTYLCCLLPCRAMSSHAMPARGSKETAHPLSV